MAKKYTTKYASNKQEKKVAKEIGGKTTIASGALSIQKADVRNDKFLIECKTTDKTYYPLTIKTWEKIKDEALHDGMRIPVMNIQLRNGSNSIALVDWHDFIAIDLDTNSYVGTPIPDLIDAKSYRITPAFLYEDFSQRYEGLYYRRHDFQFVDQGYRIVMLEWSDFLKLIEGIDF